MSEPIHLLNNLSFEWSGVMVSASVRYAIAVVFVWSLCRAFRRMPPFVHCWLWRLVYATPVIALFWLKPIEIPLLPAAPDSEVVHIPEAAPSVSANSSRQPHPEYRNVEPHMTPLVESVIAPSMKSESQPPSIVATPKPRLHLTSWLLLGWLIAVLCCLARLGLHWRDVRRMAAKQAVVTDQPSQALVTRLARQMRLRRIPKIFTLAGHRSPFLMGIRQPAIVIPSSILEDCDTVDLETILSHELAHCKRHDLVWNWLPRIVEMTFFFHPLLWLARRNWLLTQEMAADELALSATKISVQEYANSLIGIIRSYPVAQRREQFVVAMGASFKSLEQRLIAMRTYRVLPLTKKLSLVAFVTTVGIVGTIPWKATARQQPVNVVEQAASSAPAQPANELHASNSQDGKPVPSQEQADRPEAVPEFKRTRLTALQADDNQPLANLKIAVSFWRDDKQHRATYSTDDNGVAELQLPTNRNLYWLRIKAQSPGLVPIGIGWGSSRSSNFSPPSELTMHFETGVAIGGIVTDEMGQPVAGASIEIHSDSKPEPADLVRWSAHQTTSDENGRWRWNAAPPNLDDVTINVTHSDYANKPVFRPLTSVASAAEFRQQEATSVLRDGFSVAGRVVNQQGDPISDARVAVGENRLGSYLRAVNTDRNGRFAIKYSQAGMTIVTVEAEGFGPELRQVTLSSGLQDLELALKPPATIRGRVVDADGEPIEGAFAAADTWRGHRSLAWRVNTDEEGRFEWNSAPHDAMLFDFGAYGYLANRGVRLTPQDEEYVVTLQAEPTGEAPQQAATEPPDPSAILNEAVDDRNAGRFEDALAKHVWYHENAVKYHPGQSAVRLSFALSYWWRLAQQYPPAMEKLIETRDKTEERFLESGSSFDLFHDLSSLNRTLGQRGKTVEVFLAVHQQDRKAAARLYHVAEPSLVAQKVFEVCDHYLDAEKRLLRAIDNYHAGLTIERKLKRDNKNVPLTAERFFVHDLTTMVALLVKNQREDEAREIAASALEELDTEDFRTKLDGALAGNVPEPRP